MKIPSFNKTPRKYWEKITKIEQKQHYLYNYCILLILKAITMQLNLIVWTIIEYITKKKVDGE